MDTFFRPAPYLTRLLLLGGTAGLPEVTKVPLETSVLQGSLNRVQSGFTGQKVGVDLLHTGTRPSHPFHTKTLFDETSSLSGILLIYDFPQVEDRGPCPGKYFPKTYHGVTESEEETLFTYYCEVT